MLQNNPYQHLQNTYQSSQYLQAAQYYQPPQNVHNIQNSFVADAPGLNETVDLTSTVRRAPFAPMQQSKSIESILNETTTGKNIFKFDIRNSK